jgi:hypothetical protein
MVTTRIYNVSRIGSKVMMFTFLTLTLTEGLCFCDVAALIATCLWSWSSLRTSLLLVERFHNVDPLVATQDVMNVALERRFQSLED